MANGEGTGAGLHEFLHWAGRTGEMNTKTAEAWAVACRKVLEVNGDGEAVDLRSLDVDGLLARFENLNRTSYSTGSMDTYKSRFRSAVTAYLAWLANEPWKPNQRTARKRSERSPAGSTAGEVNNAAASKATDPASTQQPPAHGTVPRLVAYTVPLRPDLMVEITLPVDLTKADASRIAVFVNSLAFTELSHVAQRGLE